MIVKDKKKITLKAKVLTIIVGVVGIVYWVIGKAEHAIVSLYQN